MSSKWLKYTIVTTTEAVEPITEIMYTHGAGGVEIDDPKDFLFQKKSELDWDYVEEDVFKRNTEEDVLITTYFSDEKNIEEIIANIERDVKNLKNFDIDTGKCEFRREELDESDWANNWKQYYKPYKAGEKIVVKPSWEDYDAKEGELIIELDPGMAFGTGTHETTSMCIGILEKYINEKSNVMDIGTGSGILSIAAAKLGANKVVATDLDEVAVKVAKENIEMNSLSDRISVYHGNLADDLNVEKADIVVANIIADIIIILTDDMDKLLKKDGVFIASGIIKDKKQEVIDKLENSGFEIIEVCEKGEWVAISSRLK